MTMVCGATVNVLATFVYAMFGWLPVPVWVKETRKVVPLPGFVPPPATYTTGNRNHVPLSVGAEATLYRSQFAGVPRS